MTVTVNYLDSGRVVERWSSRDDFNPAEPRGQPENKGEWTKGGGASASAAKSLGGSTSKVNYPPRQAGELDKKYLKRIANELPEPTELPEQHDRYFHMENAKVIPIGDLVSTKSDEENIKGGNNSPKFMRAAYDGVVAKRDPISVRQRPDGKFDILDGNGTYTGVKRLGWKALPVLISIGQEQEHGQTTPAAGSTSGNKAGSAGPAGGVIPLAPVERRRTDPGGHAAAPAADPRGSNQGPDGRGGLVGNFTASGEAQKRFAILGAPALDLHEAADADEFHAAIDAGKKANASGAAVHLYNPSEYKDMRMFLTSDEKAGFALKGNDIVSVFKHSDAPYKKVSVPLLALAVDQGGRKLDCFDTVLPRLYAENNFRAVARVKFDDQFAPEGWDYQGMQKYNAGRPDVVFMVHDMASAPYKPGDGELVDDYDKAVVIQDAEVERLKDQDRGPAAYANSAKN